MPNHWQVHCNCKEKDGPIVKQGIDTIHFALLSIVSCQF